MSEDILANHLSVSLEKLRANFVDFLPELNSKDLANYWNKPQENFDGSAVSYDLNPMSGIGRISGSMDQSFFNENLGDQGLI